MEMQLRQRWNTSDGLTPRQHQLWFQAVGRLGGASGEGHERERQSSAPGIVDAENQRLI
jgi:hypothetical protein